MLSSTNILQHKLVDTGIIQGWLRNTTLYNDGVVFQEQVSKSPVMSLVMTSQADVDCGELKSNISSSVQMRSKRGLNDKIRAETPPNIDILINPDLREEREEYEEYVMNKLKNFFKDRNSTKIYPNLFRLLWYTKTPCQ